MTSVMIFLGLILIVAIVAISIYNKLVRLRNTTRSSWSDIDVQLKKRYNLIPNLVETVKAYASHEKGVFEAVTKARSSAMAATTPEEQARSENMLTGTLKSLFALSEAYPELKANENFLQLQAQLESIEEDIEAARRYYNAIVRDYNTAIEVFPAVMLAGMFGFKPAEFFQLDDPQEMRKPPKVDFS